MKKNWKMRLAAGALTCALLMTNTMTGLAAFTPSIGNLLPELPIPTTQPDVSAAPLPTLKPLPTIKPSETTQPDATTKPSVTQLPAIDDTLDSLQGIADAVEGIQKVLEVAQGMADAGKELAGDMKETIDKLNDAQSAMSDVKTDWNTFKSNLTGGISGNATASGNNFNVPSISLPGSSYGSLLQSTTVDKSALWYLYYAVAVYIVPNQDYYTQDSYLLLAVACGNADGVLRNENATQLEVNQAYQMLYTSVESLQVKKAKISKAKTGKISNKVYTGKKITPNVKVTYNGATLKKGTDYKVSFKNNVNTGIAKVTITGIGKFEGSKTLKFKILPKKVVISNVKENKDKNIVVTLKKSQGNITGYELKYATNKDFKSAKTVITKKASILIEPEKKTTYYVKVRAYKTVSGKKIYGKYSDASKVKVK